MSKYIDIDKFREAYGFGRNCKFCGERSECSYQDYTREDICSWLDDAEEEFSQPHGKWVDSDVPDSMLDKCSVCGFDCGSFEYKYCPMCGAVMDESEVLDDDN